MKTWQLRRFAPLVLLSALQLFAQPGSPPKDEAFSANKKFSVEISETELNKPLLAVFKHDGDATALLWSRSLVNKDEPEGIGAFPGGGGVRKRVSNDGGLVILQAENYFPDDAAIRVLTQKGGDTNITFEELEAALSEFQDGSDFSSRTGIADALDLFLEDEKPRLFAFWVSSVDKWLAVNLDKGALTVAAGPLAKRLDAAGLLKAREIVRVDQPGAVREMINTLKQKVSEIAPNLVAAPTGPDRREEYTHNAYRFLASRKNSEDKDYIKNLLAEKLSPSFGGSSDGLSVMGAMSSDRALGDELLAKWEGKAGPAENGEDEESSFEHGTQKKLHYFGGLSGTLYLPFRAPDNSGSLWIYLFPASATRDWAKAEGLVKLSMELNRSAMPMFAPAALHHLAFYFDTLTPGEYKLKAVWDKRPPTADANSPEAVAIPSPGDYETSESQVFRVAAGQRIENIALHCTNRVGTAVKFFAEDDAWAAAHPESDSGEDEKEEDYRQPKAKVLMAGAVSDWVVRTNDNSANLNINRVRFVEGSEFRSEREIKNLAVRFSSPRPKKKSDYRSYEAWLDDEHGCRFTSHSSSSDGRMTEIFFNILPYGSKEFRMVITEQDFGQDGGLPGGGRRKGPSASFVLTNRFKATPREWKPEGVPQKRALDLVTVELTSFNPGEGGFSRPNLARMAADFSDVVASPAGHATSGNSLRFWKSDKKTKEWRELSARFEDRWGNESTSLNEFCKAEEVFKYAVQVVREPERDNFLPDEIWEIPVDKVPGAGETIPLRLTNALQGLPIRLFAINGTGQFTYENGAIVVDSETVAEDKFAARFLAGGQAAKPRLYRISDNRGGPAYMFGARGQAGPVKIAAKIPNLACRIPNTHPETLFALLEQDTSVPEPMNARPDNRHYGASFMRPSALQFLPLEFSPGDVKKKLTFIVQKPRTAEFLVKVPAESRSRFRE